MLGGILRKESSVGAAVVGSAFSKLKVRVMLLLHGAGWGISLDADVGESGEYQMVLWVKRKGPLSPRFPQEI